MKNSPEHINFHLFTCPESKCRWLRTSWQEAMRPFTANKP